jgi:tetratricopeptide (TPR) repeat protein
MSPAEGVRVTLEKVGGGTLDQMATDNRGRFHFTSLQRGQYVVNFTAPCYQTERRQVELVLIFRSYLDVELTPDTTSPACAAANARAGAVDARVPDEARREFERGSAALSKGKDEEGVEQLGRVYLDTDQVKKAAPHIGRTLQLKPDLPEAHLLGGNILLKVGEPVRALAEYEEYLRLAPEGEYAAPTRELVGKLRKSLAEKKEQ